MDTLENRFFLLDYEMPMYKKYFKRKEKNWSLILAVKNCRILDIFFAKMP
jgi:hypothetical protein